MNKTLKKEEGEENWLRREVDEDEDEFGLYTCRCFVTPVHPMLELHMLLFDMLKEIQILGSLPSNVMHVRRL